METELSVRDVLTKDYVGVSESDTVHGAVSLMRSDRLGCVLVMRGSELLGIVTEWDVLGLIEDGGDPTTTTVGDLMSAPVITIGPNYSLSDAADTMTHEGIRNLVVTADDEIVGILTQRDVIAAAGSFRATTRTESYANTAGEPSGTEDVSEEILTNGGDEYSTQGVCEACGSLADSLWESNGQLVCTDCRSI